MIMDKMLLFSSAQAVTVTAPSTDVVDTLATGDAISPDARLFVSTTTLITGAAGTATLAVVLETSADNSTWVPLYSSGTLAFASFAPLGSRVVDAPIPAGCLRYLRLNYTVATEDLTAGAVTAGIVLNSTKLIDRGL